MKIYTAGKDVHFKYCALWVPELGLTTQDRDILLHPTTWLNDRIIDAVQKLIKKLCPAMFGLQIVLNCQTMGFDVQPDEVVQILNTGNHWFTVQLWELLILL